MVGRAVAPLWAGYGYTPEQQEAARQKIIALEATIERYKQEIHTSQKNNPHLDTALLRKKLKEVENELHQQKLITGQKWSTTRKAVWGTIALATVAALGFAAFKSLYHLPVLADPNDEDALLKNLKEIQAQEFITIAGYKVKNPAYNKMDEKQACLDLMNARGKRWKRENEARLERQHQEAVARRELNRKLQEEAERYAENVPYHSPDLVTDPSDVQGYKKRFGEIENQRFVHYKGKIEPNPHFNIDDAAVAQQDYKDAVTREGERFAANTPYRSPGLVVDSEHEVKADDLDALKQRWNDIVRQKTVRFEGRQFENPNYNKAEEHFAQKQYQQALQKIGEQAGINIPYQSPDLVVDSAVAVKAEDLEALESRLRTIESQRFIWDKGDSYVNPNFNKEDYRVAKEQYKQAFKMAVEQYAETKPYYSPNPVIEYGAEKMNSKDLPSLRFRVGKIKGQRYFTFKNKKYENPNFNKEDYLQALEQYTDHLKAFKDIPNNSLPWWEKNKEEYLPKLEKEIQDIKNELYQEELEKAALEQKKPVVDPGQSNAWQRNKRWIGWF